MGLKYHKIFNHDHINARELSEIYMSDSSDHGHLFIMLELPKEKIDQQPYVDQLINEVSTYFDTSHQENPEILLEEILQQVNQILPEMTASIKIKNWLNNLDLAVGIIYHNSVYMASIGNIHGLLIHNKQITTIMAKNHDINPNKVFSDIISGELDEKDSLVISTDSLFDYISKEKVRQLINHYTPSAAAIKINELLESVPDFVTFNSLIIKKPAITDRELENTPTTEPKYTEEKNTEGIIDTSHNQNTKTNQPRTKTVVDVKGFKNVGLVKKIGALFGLIALYFKTIGSMFGYIAKKIKNALLFLFSPNFRKKKEEKTLASIKEVTNEKYSWWQRLSLKKKIAIGALFVIALIFLQSLVFVTQEKAEDDKDKNFNNTLIQIDQKYDEVEAKLIYNDEEAAENILLEIDDLIKNMVAGSPEQQSQIDELAEKLFYKLNEIRRIHVVDSPLEKDLSQYITSSQNIVQKEGFFYILADNKLYKTANDLLTDSQLEEVFNFAGGQVAQSMTDWPGEDKVVITTLSTDEQITYAIFDLDQRKITGSLDQSNNNTSVADIRIYGNNLYVLDDKNNQVFKYPESGNGFAGGQAWIKEEIDTSAASSIAIDGSIYMIEDTGEIKNFLKGIEEDFDYHKPNPNIGAGATIKTFRDSDYLYIIDPQNYRVIVLDKEGNIKDQYASQKFDQLKDLAIDPNEKAIYLLNNQKLYLLAINQEE